LNVRAEAAGFITGLIPVNFFHFFCGGSFAWQIVLLKFGGSVQNFKFLKMPSKICTCGCIGQFQRTFSDLNFANQAKHLKQFFCPM
jgi:hypothetical protein